MTKNKGIRVVMMQKWKKILVMKTRINGSRVGEQITV